MKSFIGVKIIQAKPMTRKEFEASKGNKWNDEDSQGYKVIYPDGYVSWSPKEVFENAYREITSKEKELI